jgi:two-component system, chemotaxis family, CheB/CheR fusion protein
MTDDTEDDKDLEELLAFMRDARGFDFTGYKRSSLGRRIRRRMSTLGVHEFGVYRDVLEADAEEFGRLFDTILINVTSFFRDSDCWDLLRTEVVPDFVRRLRGDEPVRVWCPGCSSGEEAYSLAIVIAEVLGAEAFRERVKIYATDVDEDALRTARHGVYSAKALEALPEDLRERYFDRTGTSFEFRLDLRRQIIFGRHDVTRDAPISHLHLLSCRNTLMYFNAATQRDILDRFHFALSDGGYLVLGRAEMLLGDGQRFEAVSMPLRIFRARPGTRVTPQARPTLSPPGVSMTTTGLRGRILRDLSLDSSPVAHVVVDIDGMVIAINNQARATFGLTSRDEGRPLRDLEISYRPVELRSLIEQAQTEKRLVRLNAIERPLGPDDVHYLDLHVQPLVSSEGTVLGTDVIFSDVTSYVRVQEDAKQARHELQGAYEELQSTIEELETTNEELQSTIEELETTNEELQSTNEELETTNEELQSTNEELEAMNEELRTRTAELDETTRYLEAILAGVPVAVIVLDGGLRVRLWNSAAEELWGLRGSEVREESFFGLDFGLATGQLRPMVRSSQAGNEGAPVEIEAVNRRGRAIVCTVRSSPLGGGEEGVVLLMEERHPE